MKKINKYVKILLVSICMLFILSVVGFLVWANDYYEADASAELILEMSGVQNLNDRVICLYPEEPSTTGIIFYPGAKVEAIAYLPILEKLKNQGYACFLAEMPLNMAIFDSNAADKVMESVSDIDTWYLAGHSMGGAMASSYASENPDKVEGLIVMGAYVYGDYPVEKALTIYGSFNDSLEKNMDYTENIVKIEGGNHAQFGNYGKQKGDTDATISAEEQQNQTVEAICEFVDGKKDEK